MNLETRELRTSVVNMSFALGAFKLVFILTLASMLVDTALLYQNMVVIWLCECRLPWAHSHQLFWKSSFVISFRYFVVIPCVY